MIENDIRALDAREPAHSLQGLEADIWARLAERESTRKRSSRPLVVEVVLLGIAFGIAFGASALVGHYYGARRTQMGELSVFSPHMPLNASMLLIGNRR